MTVTVTVGVGVAFGLGGMSESCGSIADVEIMTETTPSDVSFAKPSTLACFVNCPVALSTHVTVPTGTPGTNGLSLSLPRATSASPRLTSSVAPKLNITQDEARIVLNSVLEVITEALVEDKNVRLVDFGTFEVKQRAERMGHNPKTGEKLKIEAKKIVTFKQGKALGEQFIVKPKQKSKAKKKA